VHDGDAVDLISEDVREDMISRGREQGFDDFRRGGGLDFLVDNPQNGEGGQFVGTEMRQMGSEPRGEQIVPRRESRRVQKPGKQKGAVWVRSQWNGVEDDRCCDTALLAEGNVGALKTCSHATSTETALGNFPHPVDNRVEDKVISGSTKAQATPQGKVSS
jgi:hypothetical protein